MTSVGEIGSENSVSGFATRGILLWRYHIISSLGKKYSISARYLCKDFPYRWFLTVRFFFWLEDKTGVSSLSLHRRRLFFPKAKRNEYSESDNMHYFKIQVPRIRNYLCVVFQGTPRVPSDKLCQSICAGSRPSPGPDHYRKCNRFLQLMRG